MLLCLFIAALWSPARKGLNSWFSFVTFYFVFVTFPCGILGQVWFLIVSIFATFLTIILISYFIYLYFLRGCDEILSIVKGIYNIFWGYTVEPVAQTM